MRRKLGAFAVVGVAVALLLYACVDKGSGSDFDKDGVTDQLEDTNDNFELDPGESDFISPDTDSDGLCDGQPEHPLTSCTGCEDCNNNGLWEPCLGETDPLDDDTNDDGVKDADDPAPLAGLTIGGTPLADFCANGNVPLAYGASLNGRPFPVRPTATPSPAPFPTSTPGPSPTFVIPVATATP